MAEKRQGLQGSNIFRYQFLLAVLLGGYTEGRARPVNNGCPGRFLISQLQMPHLLPEERCWRNSIYYVWWASVFGAPKRKKMPIKQGICSFRSFKHFALILPSPCNASDDNQFHFHSIWGTALTPASQLMQSSCSQACMKVELSWSWAALCISLMQANFLPIPPLKLWFAILKKGMESSRPEMMRTRHKLCWPQNKRRLCLITGRHFQMNIGKTYWPSIILQNSSCLIRTASTVWLSPSFVVLECIICRI